MILCWKTTTFLPFWRWNSWSRSAAALLPCWNGPPLVKIAYIDLLVVDARHRRRGIGKGLFQEVQKRARKVGFDRVELMVWSHNKIAERAYESYGMTPQRSIYEIRLNG